MPCVSKKFGNPDDVVDVDDQDFLKSSRFGFPNRQFFWSALTEDVFVFVRVESDKHSLADFHRGGSQVSGGAEHQPGERVVFGAIFLQVDFGDLLSFGDEHLRHAFQQSQRFVSAFAFLPGID